MSCTLCNVCYGLLAVIGIMWVGLRLRVLPTKVMRIWFGLVLMVNVLAMACFSFVFDKLRILGVPRKVTKIINTYVCRVTFGAVVVFNPHIRIYIDDESWKVWTSVPERSCMVLNHTSFWDAFLFVGISPWRYIYNAKTLMKDNLRKLPVFGAIFDRVGHFPVYFKSDEDGNFSVDKLRQEPVQRAVQEHIDDGGRICLFPEGAVNKQPRQLLSFRRGTFGLVLDNKMPLYYLIAAGNDVSWPSGAQIGGLPSDIVVSVHKFDVDYENQDATAVATTLQVAMQKALDENYVKRDKITGARKSD
jgi:1-acyl-sn-glycerol-3-phosphate acyltransferase